MRPPSNFQFSPDGSTLEPIPGGPADPAVIRQQAEARGAARPARVLPQGAINKLTDVGATYDSFSRLTGTFQNDYGGKYVGALGSAENLLGRNVGLGYGDQANWWQDYRAQKRRKSWLASTLLKVFRKKLRGDFIKMSLGNANS